MIAVLNGCGMIMILPEGPFPILSLIKFLPGSPCYQLDRIWYNITLLIINGKKMDVSRDKCPSIPLDDPPISWVIDY